jgi:hypothetical protein
MHNTIKHPNGQIAWLGDEYEHAGSAKHMNGQLAYLGPTYEHAGSAKWDNGQLAYLGPTYENEGRAYHRNGQILSTDGSGLEMEIGPGIRIFVDRDGLQVFVYGQRVVY